MKSTLFFLSIFLFTLSCQSNTSAPDRGAVMDSKEMAPQPAMEESQTSGGGTSPDDIKVTEQKIIRNNYNELVVTLKPGEKIEDAVARASGGDPPDPLV